MTFNETSFVADHFQGHLSLTAHDRANQIAWSVHRDPTKLGDDVTDSDARFVG